MGIDAARVREALKQVLRPCRNCDTENWLTDGSPVTFLAFDLETRAVSVGGEVLPTVPAVCKGCGSVMLFSAVELGLLARED
jgi:hypothetical protein